MQLALRIVAASWLAGTAFPGDVAFVVRGVVQSASVQSGPFLAAAAGDAVELRLEAWLPGNPLTPGQYVNHPLDLAACTLRIGGAMASAGSTQVSVGFVDNYGGVDGLRLFGLPLAAGAQPVAFEFADCAGGTFSSIDPGANLGTYPASQWCSNTFAVQGPGATIDIAPLDLAISLPSTGTPYCFGDGLRCAAGTIVRLGTKTNAAGTSLYPETGDASISVRGLVTTPGTRTYQVWYRNSASFCTPATFNLSNGVQIAWGL